MSTDLELAICQAESLLPGEPMDGGGDPRWQAIIAVAEFLEEHPEPVWKFAAKWGCHPQEDLRTAIATCVLEHLLEHHFEIYIPKEEALVKGNPLFGETFLGCWKFGQSELPQNSERFDALRVALGHRPQAW